MGGGARMSAAADCKGFEFDPIFGFQGRCRHCKFGLADHPERDPLAKLRKQLKERQAAKEAKAPSGMLVSAGEWASKFWGRSSETLFPPKQTQGSGFEQAIDASGKEEGKEEQMVETKVSEPSALSLAVANHVALASARAAALRERAAVDFENLKERAAADWTVRRIELSDRAAGLSEEASRLVEKVWTVSKTAITLEQSGHELFHDRRTSSQRKSKRGSQRISSALKRASKRVSSKRLSAGRAARRAMALSLASSVSSTHPVGDLAKLDEFLALWEERVHMALGAMEEEGFDFDWTPEWMDKERERIRGLYEKCRAAGVGVDEFIKEFDFFPLVGKALDDDDFDFVSLVGKQRRGDIIGNADKDYYEEVLGNMSDFRCSDDDGSSSGGKSMGSTDSAVLVGFNGESLSLSYKNGDVEVCKSPQHPSSFEPHFRIMLDA